MNISPFGLGLSGLGKASSAQLLNGRMGKELRQKAFFGCNSPKVSRVKLKMIFFPLAF